jgi:hypothetical protein
MDSIRLGEKAVYCSIVVGIIGAVVGVTGVIENRSVGGNLLFDPFPITKIAIGSGITSPFPSIGISERDEANVPVANSVFQSENSTLQFHQRTIQKPGLRLRSKPVVIANGKTPGSAGATVDV